ncbi:MAG: SH3 domain-containing protein [Coriobacteriia bacterium]|nr:SH3 domain-containing protein [Coriobacteriia bacterium]
MSAETLKYAKGIAAAVVLLVLVLTVRGWWSEYRDASSQAAQAGSGAASVDTTAPPPAQEGEDEAGDEAKPKPTTKPEAAAGTVVVLIDGLNFRTKPEADATPIRGLRKGEKLTLLSKRSGWYEVRSSDGSKGWVSSNPNYTEAKDK